MKQLLLLLSLAALMMPSCTHPEQSQPAIILLTERDVRDARGRFVNPVHAVTHEPAITQQTIYRTASAAEMHGPIPEFVSASIIAVQGITTAILLAIVPMDKIELIYWTLLPLLGTTIVSCGAFCFNTQQEVRRIVIGRCCFAILVGVVGPRCMSMVHPWIREVMVDPLLLVGAGAVHGFVGYLISWPFVRRAYERAPAIADKQMSAIEQAVDRKLAEKLGTEPPK
jgi:hypothetical protein